jgi:ribosomal protein S18 acetylase RimI-like enzyme
MFCIKDLFIQETDLQYRVLSRNEIEAFHQIDRTEAIKRIYHLRYRALVAEQKNLDVPDWSFSEKQQRITDLKTDYDRGATFIGAFDGPVLAGLAVLDNNPMSSGVDRYNLMGLWVSNPYRGRGIGRTLVKIVKEEARKKGAKALYASATPSENTVRFYQSIGFRLAQPIDSRLFELEPDDIHMELILF